MLVQTGAMVAYENHMFPYNMCSSHASTKPAKKKKKIQKRKFMGYSDGCYFLWVWRGNGLQQGWELAGFLC